MMNEFKDINFATAEFVKSATKPSHYPEPIYPEIAVLGRSNVGKSSLMNSLFNRRSLVKVSRTPGRTQLINFFSVDDQAYVVDLPGYGYAKVPARIKRQWRPMIESYLTKRENLLGCLYLLDIRRLPTEDDINMWEWLRHFDLHTMPVLTKADKLSSQQRRNQSMKIANLLNVPLEALVITSSKTHAGRDKLRKVIQAVCWSATINEDGDEEPIEE
jgi:GTP-binding protein